MAGKLPYIQFYPGDWLRDGIAGCSLEAQGLWLRMMFVMHDSDRYGYLSHNGMAIRPDALARRCGCSLDQYMALLTELTSAGVPATTPEGVIYSRRMVRDAKLREVRAIAGSKGGKRSGKTRRKYIEADMKQNPEDDNEDDSDSTKAVVRFKPPTTEEVREYVLGLGKSIKAARFVDYHTSKGWMVGHSPMKDWRAAARNWMAREDDKSPPLVQKKVLTMTEDERRRLNGE